MLLVLYRIRLNISVAWYQTIRKLNKWYRKKRKSRARILRIFLFPSNTVNRYISIHNPIFISGNPIDSIYSNRRFSNITYPSYLMKITQNSPESRPPTIKAEQAPIPAGTQASWPFLLVYVAENSRESESSPHAYACRVFGIGRWDWRTSVGIEVISTTTTVSYPTIRIPQVWWIQAWSVHTRDRLPQKVWATRRVHIGSSSGTLGNPYFVDDNNNGLSTKSPAWYISLYATWNFYRFVSVVIVHVQVQ